MNVEDVKKSYLNALGNPQSGVFVDFADIISEAIVADLFPEPEKEIKNYNPVTEIRVKKVTESR
jgi:hypothetical protein